MKKLMLLCLVLTLSACAGTAKDPSHRKESVMNIFGGKCPSDRYVLVEDDPNNDPGWKTQRFYKCETDPTASSIDGKIYSRTAVIQRANADPNEYVIF